MRILVVSQVFYPENFRINQLCLDLQEKGHQVTVLTGKPNAPVGEYFEGYTFKGDEDEVWNGVQILRVPLRARRKGYLNLALNYLSFVHHAHKKVRKLKNEFDLIYVFGVSPITVALPAIEFKNKHNLPLIINVQDLWPDNVVAVTGIDNKIVTGLLDIMVNYIYKKCDLILCASPSFVKIIQDRVIDKEKVLYWPQYSLVDKTSEQVECYDKNKFNITFTGGIGEAQGIDLAIKAADKLRDTNIHWHFIGDGRNRENMEKLTNDLNVNDYVTFHGYIDENEIPKYLATSDAALLILKPSKVFEMTIPAKLQTYLSCGVPIIGCVSGEGKRVIEEANCGVVSDEISVEALVETCRKMISKTSEEMNNYKINSIEYGIDNFNRKKLVDKLDNLMEEIK